MHKPIPLGRFRLVRVCATCGKPVKRDQWIGLDLMPRCPHCGSRQRGWWRRKVRIWERFQAWRALQRWKNQRRHK